ncbi:MAG: hypothetical protein EXX96DRAFT_82395 [Benjaminiella poitrasii]|nr:MAG: hypothetical protein EXX96DRAFT_82395 [Benjaminiella poitrasii]
MQNSKNSGDIIDMEDYILFIKYCLLQTKEEKEITMIPIFKDMIQSSEFKLEYFEQVFELCYQYGQDGSLIKIVLGYLLEYHNTIKKDDKECIEQRIQFIHLLILALKCTIHIKTIVYETLKNDGISRTGKLDFRSIVSYMSNLCQMLIMDLDTKQLDTCQNNVLMNDIEWMLQTSWNLGLYCFGAGRHEEGVLLFSIVNKV